MIFHRQPRTTIARLPLVLGPPTSPWPVFVYRRTSFAKRMTVPAQTVPSPVKPMALRPVDQM